MSGSSTVVTIDNPRESKLLTTIGVMLRLALGCLFGFSGLSKVDHPFDFLSAFYGYRIIAPPAGSYIAMCIPMVEICIGAALLVNVMLTEALLCATLLAAVFVTAQVSVLARGFSADCGCFGSGDNERISAGTVVRTAAILSGAAAGLALSLRPVQHRGGIRSRNVVPQVKSGHGELD